jgi:PIN domain nuclease of toxin-antitoxin system
LTLLLDTHAFLWAARDHALLPTELQLALLDQRNQILVSAASIWEIVIKASAGKHIIWNPNDPIEAIDSYIDRLGAVRLPIANDHALRTYSLRTWYNKDPFDRILAAQSIGSGATLVTADKAFRECPLEFPIWWIQPPAKAE